MYLEVIVWTRYSDVISSEYKFRIIARKNIVMKYCLY